MFPGDLERFGPQPKEPRLLSPRQSRRYCRRLARRHYENFTVASFFLPRRLRRHFYHVYAYCRWADDLADETGDPQRSLALLGWWEEQLRECYEGKASHPVFTALSETIRKFEIPADPLLDLLVAFRQDQRVTRYETWDELLQYCRYSANPVGWLVLYLGRSHTERKARLADSICTGLQLANFWQDVAGDFDRGRIYLPQADCRRYGYGEPDFARRECNEAFRLLLAAEVDQAEGWLRRGAPLIDLLPFELKLQVALFVRGGLEILEAIRRQHFDVWTSRPVVPKMTRLRILAGSWWRLQRGTLTGDEL